MMHCIHFVKDVRLMKQMRRKKMPFTILITRETRAGETRGAAGKSSGPRSGRWATNTTQDLRRRQNYLFGRLQPSLAKKQPEQ